MATLASVLSPPVCSAGGENGTEWSRDTISLPARTLQAAVMEAYEAAFATTRILLRYPTGGEGSQQLAPNAKRRFGYHDDSFAWGTLDTGKPGDSWFFMAALRMAGREALDKWKTQPIGGEIRPEAWGIVFDPNPARKEVQNFRQCVEATHVSWLMDSGMFRAEAGSRPSPASHGGGAAHGL